MRLGLVTVIAVLAVSGCGNKEADIAGIEQQIKDGVRDQADTRVTVDCPDSIDWKVGGEFHCFADESNGTRHLVTVSMENDDGDASWVLEN